MIQTSPTARLSETAPQATDTKDRFVEDLSYTSPFSQATIVLLDSFNFVAEITYNLLASECPHASSNLQIHVVLKAKHHPVVSSANLKTIAPHLPLDLLSLTRVLPDDLLHNSNTVPTLALLVAIASGPQLLYQCPVS